MSNIVTLIIPLEDSFALSLVIRISAFIDSIFINLNSFYFHIILPLALKADVLFYQNA